MKKIIEFKNLKTGSEWAEDEPRYHDAVKAIRRLRQDEKINQCGILYRIRSVNA